MSDQEILNPTPAEDGQSEIQEPKPRASRGRRRTTPESQDGTAMADEGQTATAVIDAPDVTDTSAERTEPREREFSRRNRNGGRNDRDRDRSGRRDRHDRGDRPERGNRADRGERSDYGPREIRSHEMEPQEFPSNGTNPDVPHFTVTELDQMEPEALIELARTFEIQGFSRMKRTDLISRLLRARTEMEGNIFGDGVLEIIEDGFGFLRGLALPARTRTTSTSRSRRFAASACAPATASPARCVLRRTTRSSSACCASKPSMASIPKPPAAGRASTR